MPDPLPSTNGKKKENNKMKSIAIRIHASAIDGFLKDVVSLGVMSAFVAAVTAVLIGIAPVSP